MSGTYIFDAHFPAKLCCHLHTVGLNKATVQKYIRDQELEDQAEDRRSLKEYKDPFTGK